MERQFLCAAPSLQAIWLPGRLQQRGCPPQVQEERDEQPPVQLATPPLLAPQPHPLFSFISITSIRML